MTSAAWSALLLASLLFAQVCSGNGECGDRGSCLNGGKCVQTGGKFSCSCPPSYAGEICEHLNPCHTSPCQPDRTCIVRTGSSGAVLAECSCPTGWTGELCNIAADVCSVVNSDVSRSTGSTQSLASASCFNGGTCLATDAGRKACRCPPGFTGPRCEFEDECANLRPCQHSGTCFNTPNGYRCQCSPLYTGNNCERVFMPCQPSPCDNGGICNVTGTFTYTCACPAGFIGAHCQDRIGNCSGHRCASGSRCLAVTSPLGYFCQCRTGYTGIHCTEDVNECQMSPCLNGGTCQNISPGYVCTCPYGWTGSVCQTNIDDCSPNPCRNGGSCHDGIGSYLCSCPRGWTGASCQQEEQCPRGLAGRLCDVDIDECSSSPCQNNGTCIDQLNRFHCSCSQGYRGKFCQLDVNECTQSPCRNGATCRNKHGSFACDCAAGFEGENCETNTNDCVSNPCRNGGTCVDQVNSYMCVCRRGFIGRDCSLSEQSAAAAGCTPQPCHSAGTASCSQHADGYHCICKGGWHGRWCDIEIVTAPGGSLSRQASVGGCSTLNPCQNGGRCVVEAAAGLAMMSAASDAQLTAAWCHCPAQFTGLYCEAVLARAAPPCSAHSCRSGATCSAVGDDGYRCLCPPGSHGSLCEASSSSAGCHSSTRPCGHNVLSCRDVPGGVVCQCKENWSGVRCQTWNGPGDGPLSQTHPSANNTLLTNRCAAACTIKASNGRCDAECNTSPCLFDGGDCLETARAVPWVHCSAATASGKSCRDAFNDGTCDNSCNIEGCLYDGFDCLQPRRVCDPTTESYCKLHYGNGYCDRGCYNEECGWDGLDCLQQSDSAAAAALARGELLVVVLVSPHEFLNQSGDFLLTLGRLLRTVVKLKLDEHGRPAVVPWTTVDAQGQLTAGSLVALTLDNSKCRAGSQRECFETAASAAEFVAASLNKGWTPGLGIGTVSASSADSPEKPGSDVVSLPAYVYLVAGAVVLIIVAVLVGAYFGGRRKRARGATWFPEGFAFSSTEVAAKRKCPEGEAEEEVEDAKVSQNGDEDGDEQLEPLAKKHCSTAKAGKEIAIELMDKRMWNARHYDACLKTSALTPPRHDEQLPDANCRGPSGITPLMLAATSAPIESCGSLRSMPSTSGSSSQSAEDLEALTELIDQGANIRERDDRGETALHHAARCGRAEEARFLLDKGADPNAKDLTGRTPLHAAVAADAYRVFQTLLRDRRTNLNERAHDGATPMILAARLAVDDMVAELLQNKADVNAADEHGKTALHWAAAVNNVPAATMLLKYGVNCDVQDDQEQTPLHLAAKEGSYEVATLLVGYGASLDIADCQERLPEDLAFERRHRRLIALLQQHCGQQMAAGCAGLVSATGGIGAPHRRLSKKRCHKGRLGVAPAATNGWWRANSLQPAGLLLGGEEAALPLYVNCVQSQQAQTAARLAIGGRCTGGSLSIAGYDHGTLSLRTRAFNLGSGLVLNGGGGEPPLSSYSAGYGNGGNCGGWPSDTSAQMIYGSHTLPVKQQQLQHGLGMPSGGAVSPSWQSGCGREVGSFCLPPGSAAYSSADYRLHIEGQRNQRAGPVHSTTVSGITDDLATCRWGGRAGCATTTAPAAADCMDSSDVACAATPSPDSGTGWSSDCSGLSPAACVSSGGGCRPADYRLSCDAASRPDRLSSLSNGSPQSDWSDCISPIEPGGERHDAVFA